MRAWLAEVYPVADAHFAVRVLGGKFTAKHRGQSWDAIQGYCRTKEAEGFAILFSLQFTMRFGRKEHGYDEALFLVSKWITRMCKLHELWVESGCDLSFWHEGLALEVDDLELVTAMLEAGDESALYIRGSKIRAVVPIAPEEDAREKASGPKRRRR